MNVCYLKGKVVNEPTIKFLDVYDKYLASVRIVVSEMGADKQFRNTYLNVTCFGQNADYVRNNIKENDKIYVSGSIKVRSYDDKDGKKVYVTEINAREINKIVAEEIPAEEYKEPEDPNDIDSIF